MATKTEDSLVFSWEGRNIYHFFVLFRIYSGHFLLDVLSFIFVIDVPSFAFVLVVYLYVCDLHSNFTAVSYSHFDAFGQILLICKNTSMV